MTEGYAHWVVRRVWNDVTVSDWTPYPEGGETEDSLITHLREIFGRDSSLVPVGWSTSTFELCNENDWQFTKVLVSTSISPAINDHCCSGTVKQILLNQFGHSLPHKRPSNDEGLKDPWSEVFGQAMFVRTDIAGIYQYCNDVAVWQYFDYEMHFTNAKDAVKYKLMT